MIKIYQIREVAKLLRLAPETVYRKVKTGEIPAVRIGGRLRVPESLLKDWLEQKQREPVDRWTHHLHRFVSLLQKEWGSRFQSLVLFGSRSAGKERPASDIDVLIIASVFPKSRLDRQGTLYDMAKTVSVSFAHRLSPVALTPEEAAEGRPLYLGMLESHEILWDQDGFFKQVMERFRESLQRSHAERKLTTDGLPYWVFPEVAA